MKVYPQSLFDRVFGLELIDGNGAVDQYLRRWTLLKLPNGRRLYLHHFVGSDWSRHMHDHPKPFVSIGLRGAYVEGTPKGPRRWVAPWIRRFPARHIHRLRINRSRPCWTLVYVGRPVRDWGFWTEAGWIEWSLFVRMHGGQK